MPPYMPNTNPLREMTPEEWAAYPQNQEEIIYEAPTADADDVPSAE
jgi:hypothetical protein